MEEKKSKSSKNFVDRVDKSVPRVTVWDYSARYVGQSGTILNGPVSQLPMRQIGSTGLKIPVSHLPLGQSGTGLRVPVSHLPIGQSSTGLHIVVSHLPIGQSGPGLQIPFSCTPDTETRWFT